MDKWKKILFKFVYPHIAILIVAVTVAVIGLIYSFASRDAIPALQYCSYGISAYALLTLCFRLPKFIARVNEYRKKNRYIARYVSDDGLRVKVSLYVVVVANLVYSGFNIYLGFTGHSVWFYSLAGYYILLTLIRCLLLNGTRNKELSVISQWKRYRICGALLVAMNVLLSGIVFYIVYQNKGFTYHFIHTIAMAAYTFTITTVAIVNVIRYRKSSQPLISAVKFISFAAALVSMLSLENVMLNVFGEADGEAFRQLMTAITGAAICIVILVMGIYMVSKGTSAITKGNRNQ